MRVVIALDGSTSAEQGLRLAETLLTGKESHIVLMHVLPRHFIYGKGGPVPIECYDADDVRTDGKALLDAATARLKVAGAGTTIEQNIVAGHPADLILKTATEPHADLIILGSRGLNGAQRFLLGSVSHRVSQHAHCTVLVAHAQAPRPTRRDRPGSAMLKVLVAIDGSTVADHALDVACTLLSGIGVEVTLLHVIPRHLVVGRGGLVPAECYDVDIEQEAAQALVDSRLPRLQQGGIGPTLQTEIAIGDPAEVILDVAEENGVDLIVLGGRGVSNAERWLLGSVAHKVATHAGCSVLIVPRAPGMTRLKTVVQPTGSSARRA
ncbi:MAG: UspA [Chloroflexi bacterium]|nr:UspA [Chloroflexota bacterium]